MLGCDCTGLQLRNIFKLRQWSLLLKLLEFHRLSVIAQVSLLEFEVVELAGAHGLLSLGSGQHHNVLTLTQHCLFLSCPPPLFSSPLPPRKHTRTHTNRLRSLCTTPVWVVALWARPGTVGRGCRPSALLCLQAALSCTTRVTSSRTRRKRRQEKPQHTASGRC